MEQHMNESAQSHSTNEAWESEELGADETHVRVTSPEVAQQIDDALGLQMISIRLQKELIDMFKLIAEYHGVGYQPLMRDALKRFIEAETKQILVGVVQSQKKRGGKPTLKEPPKQKKAA